MNRLDVSKITCVADVRLTARIEAEADRMGILETYTERAKQVALKPRSIWLPLGRHSTMAESPSDIIRLYVPRTHERAAMARLATAADLFLPGRGSIFAEDAVLIGTDFQLWDQTRLCSDPPSWAAENRMEPSPYDLIFCILPRGRGTELASAILEMGLCVPIVSYGEGMGMRDRLGLLRITIPQEKEILGFLVPPGDSDFVVDVAVRKAGLQEPGRGFLGRIPVRALAINARMNLAPRRHVATMEQVITTLDQLRGSTDWRRLSAAARHHRAPEILPNPDERVRLTLIGEEGTSSGPVRAALDAGAGGATLSRLSRRTPVAHEGEDEVAIVSHAREFCDLVVRRSLLDHIEDAVIQSGLLEDPTHGFIELGPIHDTISYTTPTTH